MRLRLHLVLPASAARHDTVVAAAPGTTVAQLRAALASCVDTDGLALHVAGHPVPDTARLGNPPLLDGATLTFAPDAPRPPTSALLALHVRTGPDTGHVFDLPPGEHLVGRSTDAPLRLDDPAVSRAHAVVQVRTRQVMVRDAGSTNATFLDDLLVGSQPVPLAAGQRLRVGGTTLVLHVPRELPAAARPDGKGHLLVNRSPCLASSPARTVLEFPQPPPEGTPPPLSWVAAVLPLALSVLLAGVLRSPTMLLLGLMSPVVLVGQWLVDRRGARRSRREALAGYADALAAAEDRLTEALARETALRHEHDPEPSLLLAMAAHPQSRLWERRASLDLRARVGLGQLPATTSCPGRPTPVVGPVPVDADLSSAGGLAVAGPRSTVLAAARALVGRTAVLYSPSEVQVLVVTTSEHRWEWEWVSRLPHFAGDRQEPPEALLAGLGALLTERAATPATPAWSAPRLLVVVDGVARWRPHPALSRALADGHRHGVHVLSLDEAVSWLPGESSTILDLTTDPATLRRGKEEAPVPVAVDALGLRWADRLAEALLPLRDAAPPASAARLPATVSLLDLLGLGEVDPDTVARGWMRFPRSTSFPIGADGEGPVVVDLAADGPHVLVGGTTGSGKSELLLALVAALAARNRPDELCFVLVDYKGGAAFAGCVDLPHVVGVVTDLDAELTERALVSLDAELKRRERLLAERRCPDLAAYSAAKRPQDPPMPRLVIVVDEFRSLSHDLPDFVAGLVRVASLGRSLGISLVVATQRPAGVVTADMRANLGLRIGLRMRDAVDSLDVLDAPDAARILEHAPGRGLLRSAASPLTGFQGALVTGRSPAQDTVTLVSFDGVPLAAPDAHADTDLARLVVAARGAASTLGIPRVPSPWLPPLPAVVPAHVLSGAPGTVALGLVDDPAQQTQGAYLWDWDAGPLAVTGPPRSGRTTALLTVAAQLGRPAADVHVYAVHTGDLEELESLPHVGAAVDLTDLSRLQRLLRLLTQPGPPADPPRVLLVDDWEAVAQALQDARQPALLDALVALVRRGHQHRLRAVVTGARVASSLTGAFGQRLLLQPADPVDLALAGVPVRTACGAVPPGRAIDVGWRRQVQLALAAAPATLAEGSDDAAPAAGSPSGGSRLAPPAVSRLPLRVSREQLVATDGVVTVGVGPQGPVGFRLEQGQRRVALLGRRGSGRTTALGTLALSLLRLGFPVAALSPADTDRREGWTLLGRLADVPVLRPDDVEDLVALRREHPTLALLVDDTDQLSGTRAETVVTEIARLVDQDRGFVAAASHPREAVERPGGLAGTLAGTSCGVLLGQLQPGDALALGVRELVPHGGSPGRAHIVQGGAAEVVQLAG